MAPEGLQNRVVEKSDVYSFGIMILFFCFDTELATRLMYYPIKSSAAEIFTLSKICPMFKLVVSMIEIDPLKRITLEHFDTILCDIPQKFTNKPISESFLEEVGVDMKFLAMDLMSTTDMQLLENLDIRKDNIKKG